MQRMEMASDEEMGGGAEHIKKHDTVCVRDGGEGGRVMANAGKKAHISGSGGGRLFTAV